MATILAEHPKQQTGSPSPRTPRHFRSSNPNHHLWRNGRLWWIHFTVLFDGWRHGSLRDKIDYFEAQIMNPLTRAVERIKRDHPAYFRRHFEGGAVAEVLFVGLESGSPVLLLRYFRATSLASGQVLITAQRRDCPGNCPSGIAEAFLGEKDAIEKFRAQNPKLWRAGLVEGIRKLIEMEIADKPELVSPPIDILRIDRNGPQWIQRKPECSEIKPSWRP